MNRMPSSSDDTNPFGDSEPSLTRQETESIISYLRHHPKVVVAATLSILGTLLALIANVITVWLTK